MAEKQTPDTSEIIASTRSTKRKRHMSKRHHSPMSFLKEEKSVEKKGKMDDAKPCVSVSNMLSTMMLEYFVKESGSKESVVVSPFGLTSALSMLLIGLTEKTLDEVTQKLSITDKQKLFDDVVEMVTSVSKSITVNNFVLTKEEVYVFESYLNNSSKLGQLLSFKQSEIHQLVDRVNELVEKKTKGFIKNLLKPDDVNEFTFLVLLNTLFMDLKWNTSFDEELEKNEPFYGLEKIRTVTMMNAHEQNMSYYENEKYQVVSLLYSLTAAGYTSMYVIVPKDKKSPPPILTAEEIASLKSNFKTATVNLKLPDFEVRNELDLIPFFEKNGMGQMFKYMHADDMIERHDEQRVTAFRQSNVIKVNKTGTRVVSATAATAICIETCSPFSGQKKEKVYNVYADHPFSYCIVHYETGLIFCSGVHF
jgi:serine protease inhibitor